MNTTTRKLLIIEDDQGLLNQLKWCFSSDIEVSTASTPESALEKLRLNSPQVVTLDLGLPPDPGGVSAGFGLLEQILNLTPHCKIIVIVIV